MTRLSFLLLLSIISSVEGQTSKTSSSITTADGLPRLIEPVWVAARAVVGRADAGRVRRGRALPGGRVVLLDETSVGEDGWFRFDGVTREECLLVGAAGRLQIPASEAASTDVGDLRGHSGGAK